MLGIPRSNLHPTRYDISLDNVYISTQLESSVLTVSNQSGELTVVTKLLNQPIRNPLILVLCLASPPSISYQL